MNTLTWICLITVIAGFGGTGLGGLVGAILRRDSTKVVSLLLAFAGGVMMGVVCFELIPESFHPVETKPVVPLWFVIFGIILGYGLIFLLNRLIDKKTDIEVQHKDDSHPKTADDLDELIHADHYHTHREKGGLRHSYELFIAGVVMACAIALHNVPEGMVIGASYAGNHTEIFGGAGFILAVVIGLHNVPEGMAVSVPLISGGMSKWRAIGVAALSGLPTVIGAILGYTLGMLSPLWLALSLSFAGGAMLYVVFGELLPEAFLMYKSKSPAVFVLLGTLVGLILVRT